MLSYKKQHQDGFMTIHCLFSRQDGESSDK